MEKYTHDVTLFGTITYPLKKVNDFPAKSRLVGDVSSFFGGNDLVM